MPDSSRGAGKRSDMDRGGHDRCRKTDTKSEQGDAGRSIQGKGTKAREGESMKR
jgi:hypothetical protein